jgi:NADH-quinone oxidoreductase subunit D
MCDVGVIAAQDAIGWGSPARTCAGPASPHDLRKDKPYLGYERYEFDVPVGDAGDCYDRYLVRMEEMRQSIRIIRQVIDKCPPARSTASTRRACCPTRSG